MTELVAAKLAKRVTQQHGRIVQLEQQLSTAGSSDDPSPVFSAGAGCGTTPKHLLLLMSLPCSTRCLRVFVVLWKTCRCKHDVNGNERLPSPSTMGCVRIRFTSDSHARVR